MVRKQTTLLKKVVLTAHIEGRLLGLLEVFGSYGRIFFYVEIVLNHNQFIHLKIMSRMLSSPGSQQSMRAQIQLNVVIFGIS